MRTFFAVQQDKIFNSGWHQCISWAHQQLQENDAAIQLLSARGGDKDAIVIAEITAYSTRMISCGRTFPVKRLMNVKAEI